VTTLDHVDMLDMLRGTVEYLRGAGGTVVVGKPLELAAGLERAADHLEDLADKLSSAEDDIARLNDEVSTYAANMATIREWVDWIAVESASGETSSGPSALLDAYPGITLVEPKPEEEEPTTHE